MKIPRRILSLAFAFVAMPLFAGEESTLSTTDNRIYEHTIVTYQGADAAYRGHWFEPKTPGRHPVMIFHHGHHKTMFDLPSSRFESLAKFYVDQGFIFFAPDRRALSDGSSKAAAKSDAKESVVPAKLESINLDVLAALAWVKQQPNVDTNRIAMSGLYSGAVQTLLAAEKGLGVRAFVAFSPGVTTWNQDLAFREQVRKAATHAKAPVFLCYVENDRSLDPVEDLRIALEENNRRNVVRLYPSFGRPNDSRVVLAMEGVSVWRADVSSFLQRVLQN